MQAGDTAFRKSGRRQFEFELVVENRQMVTAAVVGDIRKITAVHADLEVHDVPGNGRGQFPSLVRDQVQEAQLERNRRHLTELI